MGSLPTFVRARPSEAARAYIEWTAERIDAGETVRDIAADYDLDSSEIEQAALYEWAA